jgi:hypothetical protein
MTDVLPVKDKFGGILDLLQKFIYVVFIGISVVMSLIIVVLAVAWVVMLFAK